MDGFKTVFRESSISRDLCNEAVECNGVLEGLRSNLIESSAITASRAVDERLHKELGNPTGPVRGTADGERFSNLERARNHDTSVWIRAPSLFQPLPCAETRPRWVCHGLRDRVP